MELYTTRHGETTANKEGIAASLMTGYFDNLTEEGLDQAKRLIPRLKEHNFTVVILSPMKRTRQTIQPYLDSLDVKPKIITLDFVTERDLGDLSGKTMQEVGNMKKNSGLNEFEWLPLKGESDLDVEKRARKFIKYLYNNFKHDAKILLCSHSHFLRVLDMILNNGDPKDFSNYKSPHNCEIGKYIL